MDKWGAVNTKHTKEGGVPRSTVVVCVLAGVLIAVGLFVAGMWAIEPVVDPIVQNYVQNVKEAPVAYNFYDSKIGLKEQAIYFVGSSIVADAIYPDEISEILEQNDYTNLSLYILHMGGDTPLRRVPEIQKMIDSSPSLVIYGVTYRSVTDPEWVDERVTLVHDQLDIRPDSLHLFTKKELQDMEYDPDPFYMRKFWQSSLEYLVRPYVPYADGYGLYSRYTLQTNCWQKS